jgi:uncharacterized protein DUF397
MDLTSARWHKSSYSGNGGNTCVEVARNLPEIVAVRDSKDAAGPVLMLPPPAWHSFITGVTSGDFDLL